MIYLAPYVGSGTAKDPFKPRQWDSSRWDAIDLRPDPTRIDGWCLLRLSEYSRDSKLKLIGISKDEKTSKTASKALKTEYKSSSLAESIFSKLLPTLWPNSQGIYEIWLGELFYRLAPIRGGQTDEELWKWVLNHPISGGAVLATDNFNRADSATLGANWSVMTGQTGWQIVSNSARVLDTGVDCADRYSAVSWPNDQYSQAEVTLSARAWVTGEGLGLLLRGSAAAETFYRFVTARDTVGDDSEFGKVVTGTFTALATRSFTFSSGQVLYASASGTTIVLKYNGSQLGASITDSAIASGSAGVASSSTVNGTDSLDNWEGGSIESSSSEGRLALLGVGT